MPKNPSKLRQGTVAISETVKGFYLLYQGVLDGGGRPVSARCVSVLSVNQTLTRWSKKHGTPLAVVAPAGLTVEQHPGKGWKVAPRS